MSFDLIDDTNKQKTKFSNFSHISSIYIRNLHGWMETDNKKKSLDGEQCEERCSLDYAEKLVLNNSGESQ